MKSSTNRMMTATFALSLAAGCAGTIEPLGTDTATEATYAKAVYGNYEEAAGGKIGFDVTTVEEGTLEAIAQRPLVDVLDGVPTDWIVFHSEGTVLDQVARGPRNAETDEWMINPPALTDFDAMGFPVADGSYRLLDVTATLDGTTTKHRSLELCWQSLDHCVVVDPVVMQLDGFYQNRQKWIAEGWQPEITTEDEPAEDQMLPTGTTAATRSCKLSRFSTYSKRYYWPALYSAGYNALGWKLFENHIGAQDINIRCYVNSNGACKAAASSTSYSSSCSTFMFNWNCDCENVDYFAYTGSTAKTSAVSKCVDNFGGATVNAGIEGGGATFTVSWTISAGSVYTNGGSYTDTCIWQ